MALPDTYIWMPTKIGETVKVRLVDSGDGVTYAMANVFTTNGSTPLGTLEQSRAASTSDVHAPASNTAAVVTYAAAGSGVSNVIGGIAWSYNATPTAGNLKVEDGSGNTVFTVDITAAGPGFFIFPRPKKGTANTALIITLAAGGSGVSGKVSVSSHWLE